MTFVHSGKFEVLLGENAGSVFKQVVTELRDIMDAQDVSIVAAIDQLLKTGPDKLAQRLLVQLNEWVADHGSQEIADLFLTLESLEKHKDSDRRKVGWPAAKWTSPDKLSEGLDPLSIKLEANGGAYFEVLSEDNKLRSELPGASKYEAMASLNLVGSGRADLGGKFGIPYGGVDAGITAKISRAASFYFGYEFQNERVGLALASALAQVRNPSSGKQLVDIFAASKKARLSSVVVSGDGEFGGNAKISAKFPTAYGTPGISLEGRASLSKGFSYSITSAGEKSLLLKAKTERKSTRAGEIGVSYKVGLSTIAPQFAADLLKHATTLHEQIVAIDKQASDLAGKAKSWLKPGDLLEKEIQKHLKALFKKTEEAELPKRPIAVLARAFGVSSDADLTTKKLKDSILDQTTAVIAEVLDEIPEIFGIDDSEIRSHLSKAFGAAIDANTLELLDTNVFAKMETELSGALKKLTGQLDDAVASAIEKAFGRSGEDLIDALVNLISKARNVAQTILDGVSKAQTDLLAAEIGFHRAKEAGRSISFASTFDMSQKRAAELFTSAVSAPSVFGDLILNGTDVPGVSIDTIDLTRTLTRSSGNRWNISFIGLSVGKTYAQTQSVKIRRTIDGVYIDTSGQITRTSKLLDESRRVSFLTAMNLYEARDRVINHVEQSGTNKATREPNAPASLKIDFEEEDGGLHFGEAKDVLKSFTREGLISDDVYRAVLNDVEDAIDAADRKHVKASLSVGLAVPPSAVKDLLKFVHESEARVAGLTGDGSRVTSAIVEALAEVDAEGVKSLIVDSADGGDSDLDEVKAALADLDMDLDTAFGRKEFLGAITEDILSVNVAGFRPEKRRINQKFKKRRNARRKQMEYASSIDALTAMLKRAAEIYFDDIQIDPSNEREVEARVNDWQTEMNEQASYYLKVGTPPPNWLRKIWRGRLPKKTVGLFKALQTLSYNATSVRPPLMVSFKPDNGTSTSYFSLPPSPTKKL